MDKFALVYEFNKESPLITYEAAKELEDHNYEKALELFGTAITRFPYHPTVYFLSAIALAHNNQFDLANENLIKGNNLLNETTTFEYYLKLVEKIKLNNKGIDLDSDNSFNNILGESIDKNSNNEKVNLELTNPTQKDSIINKPIITETLAEIYASQGNYKEALEIYEKLKNLKPDLKEKFDNRIQEIKITIENKKQNKFGI